MPNMVDTYRVEEPETGTYRWRPQDRGYSPHFAANFQSPLRSCRYFRLTRSALRGFTRYRDIYRSIGDCVCLFGNANASVAQWNANEALRLTDDLPDGARVRGKILETAPRLSAHGSLETCGSCDLPIFSCNLTEVEGDSSVCEECLDRYYTRYGGEYVSNDNLVWVYQEDGDRFRCHERETDEYYYSDSLDRWQDYEPDPDEEYRTAARSLQVGTGILAYHQSKKFTKHHPCKSPGPYVGFELEIEVDCNKEIRPHAQVMMNLMNVDLLPEMKDKGHYWLAESDGSLVYGFELVSCWTDLPTHEKYLKRFDDPKLKETLKWLRSHDTDTCGLHVHVSKDGMSQLHLGKLAVFMNSDAMRPFLKALYRRYSTSYAKVKKKKLVEVNQNPDRYDIVNFTNPNTVEFRGAKGTLRWQSIMATLEFARSAWLFTKDASINQLNEEAYLNWCFLPENRQPTQYLRTYLAGKLKKFAWLARKGEDFKDF